MSLKADREVAANEFLGDIDNRWKLEFSFADSYPDCDDQSWTFSIRRDFCGTYKATSWKSCISFIKFAHGECADQSRNKNPLLGWPFTPRILDRNELSKVVVPMRSKARTTKSGGKDTGDGCALFRVMEPSEIGKIIFERCRPSSFDWKESKGDDFLNKKGRTVSALTFLLSNVSNLDSNLQFLWSKHFSAAVISRTNCPFVTHFQTVREIWFWLNATYL